MNRVAKTRTGEAEVEHDRHEFGSRHTLEKLRMIEKYLPAYMTAPNGLIFGIHYALKN